MKRKSIYKSLVVSVALSSVLAGCGSSSSDDSKPTNQSKKTETTKSTYINGKAIDGYLQYSTVCLDLNQDGYCQDVEPLTQTKADGSFKLEIKPQILDSQEYKQAMLLVYGGRDVDSGKDFKAKLQAPKGSEIINITPITTIVAKNVQKELQDKKSFTDEEIEEKIKRSKESVAAALGISVDDLTKDPVALKDKNPKLIKETLKIHKGIEALSKKQDTKEIEAFYEKLAQEIKISDKKSIDEIFDIAFKDEAGYQNAKTVYDNVETIFDGFNNDVDLKRVSAVVNGDLAQIRKNKPVTKIGKSDKLFSYDEDEWKKIYIKSDLEDIGYSDLDDDIINEIEKKFGDDIRPGFLYEKSDELKDSDDELFKAIHEQISKKEAQKEGRDDLLKAKFNPSKIDFKKGDIFYELDIYGAYFGYTSAELSDDGKLIVEDYKFDGKDFVKESYENEDTNEMVYVLRDGSWVEDNESEMEYEIVDGQLKFSVFGEANIYLQKDLSNQKYYIKELDQAIKMPQGAKVSYINAKNSKDEYVLYYKPTDMSDISTLEEVIDLMGKKGDYQVDSDDKRAGYILKRGTDEKIGKWSLESIDGMDMIIEKFNDSIGYEKIYSFIDEKLYSGSIEKVDEEEQSDPNYNEIAMEAIKSYIKTIRPDSTFEPIYKDKVPSSRVEVKVKDSKEESMNPRIILK